MRIFPAINRKTNIFQKGALNLIKNPEIIAFCIKQDQGKTESRSRRRRCRRRHQGRTLNNLAMQMSGMNTDESRQDEGPEPSNLVSKVGLIRNL